MSFQCRDCKGSMFREDWKQGDVICTGCGLVQSRIVDPGEEKRMFADSTDDNPHRSAMENEYLQHGLGTTISRANPRTDRSKISRITDHTATANDRNIMYGIQQLTQYCTRLGLSNRILNKSKKIYSEFEQNRPKFTRGRDKCTYVAVLYMACREEGFARSYKELASATSVDVKHLRKNFARLQRVIEAPQTKEIVAGDLIPRICNKMKLAYSVENVVNYIAEKARQHMIGKRPNTVAAASIKIACDALGEPKFERDIAIASGVSTSTLRIALRQLAHVDITDLLPEHLREGAQPIRVSSGPAPKIKPAPAPVTSTVTTTSTSSISAQPEPKITHISANPTAVAPTQNGTAVLAPITATCIKTEK